MIQGRHLVLLLPAALLAFGCGDDDAGVVDGGRVDGGRADVGSPDAGTDAFVEADAGSDAGPRMDAGPSTRPDPGLVGRAAVHIAACAGGDSLRTWLRDIYGDAYPTSGADPDGFLDRSVLEGLSCVDALTSCDGLYECIGLEVESGEGCAEGCAGSEHTLCLGGDKLRLDCQVFFGTDCNAAGDACADYEAPPGSTTCDPETFEEFCTADAPTYCVESGGFVVTEDSCADYGLECTVDGEARCRGTTPTDACRFNGGVLSFEGTSCAGDVLTTCLNGGEATVDCAAAFAPGASCYTVGDTSFCGLSDECDPTSSETEPTCEDDTVVFCNAGRLDRVDCTSRGFAGCDTESTLGCLFPF